ncbi:dTDP-4-dehydrorhamnose reductase [Tabrizicola sp.]|uniref:dTDP-4-dehydrorhamnose reductase n=1 Tax=Tabrizicola sp. TaxID=2005166 RepID=UPI0025FC9CB8|nr:dTDP-4-dehydrorhamnose reductase [Tabrizicola sp.]MBY0350624.1 dTDP-4-dehydrorhamnose reductase [Tabrizicola sp.]MDK2775315.1 dTDP-4-dehydrorhamnose reductase [Tabrizicola sp.]
MRLLVFGKTGQVARELQRLAPDATFMGRNEADLLNPAACARAITATDASAVINAAAWTAVDKAETEEAAATVVNGEAPAAMARAAAAKGIPFLHISTDYVFDGAGDQPFTPDYPTAPQNAYGRSKMAGEQGVRAAGGPHLILRTSWVVSAHGANFVKTMLRLGAERETLNVVANQIGGPTPAAAIADALLTAAKSMIQGAPGGTHHFSGTPDTSWAGFARAIMTEANLPCQINDIPTTEYPTPAKRPLNSRLDCSAFTSAFGIPRPDWRLGLKAIVKELTQ